MELTVFCVFVAISLILIGLGYFVRNHAEISLAGFLFLFLLSLQILAGNITMKTGQITNTTYTYNSLVLCADGTVKLDSSQDSIAYVYTPIEIDGTLSHAIGYWMAIISIIGFAGVLLSLKKTDW